MEGSAGGAGKQAERNQKKETTTMITLKKNGKDHQVSTIVAHVAPRYWEDSRINFKADDDIFREDTEEGDLIPCRIDGEWRIEIDLETGQIKNWTKGVRAFIHYKVCEAGDYTLLDQFGNKVCGLYSSYVPEIMTPDEDEDCKHMSDYIIMRIDENGFIKDWNVTFKGFEE